MEKDSKFKTLFISDLDGTLLTSKRELSEYTVASLNRLIEAGVYFSVATARTIATVIPILAQVPVNLPVILMNGVLVYDMRTKMYINREILSASIVKQVLAVLRETRQTGLMYALAGDELMAYYEKLDIDHLKYFVEERKAGYQKKFTQIDDFADADTDIIYFCFLNTYDNINQLRLELKDISGLRLELYQDIYAIDFWYLEVFSDRASKHNAVQFIRQYCGFEWIVGFGDNTNDLSFFEACDECYAVANAIPEIKERATATISSNEEDGVVKWLNTLLL